MPGGLGGRSRYRNRSHASSSSKPALSPAVGRQPISAPRCVARSIAAYQSGRIQSCFLMPEYNTTSAEWFHPAMRRSRCPGLPPAKWAQDCFPPHPSAKVSLHMRIPRSGAAGLTQLNSSCDGEKPPRKSAEMPRQVEGQASTKCAESAPLHFKCLQTQRRNPSASPISDRLLGMDTQSVVLPDSCPAAKAGALGASAIRNASQITDQRRWRKTHRASKA